MCVFSINVFILKIHVVHEKMGNNTLHRGFYLNACQYVNIPDDCLFVCV